VDCLTTTIAKLPEITVQVFGQSGQEKGSQGVNLGVWDDLNAATAEPFGLRLFHGHGDENLASRPAAALSRANTANHGLTHFDIAGQSIMSGVPNGATETVKHRPGSLVGTKAKKTMERLGGHPVLRRRHVPGGREPYSKRCLRVMEDGARRGRYPASARLTPPPAILHAPPRVARTFWARKTGRPTELIQMIEAGRIVREPAEKVGIV
jgi:hypothetical protein